MFSLRTFTIISILLIIIANNNVLSEEANDICCKSTNSFKVCWKIFGLHWTIGPEVYCPEDYYCDGAFNTPCLKEILNETTTEVPTTTTMQTTTGCPIGEIGTEPTCNSTGVYPGPYCTQYYECTTFLVLWYEMKLKECDSGTAFSPSQNSCIEASGSCECVD